jgi:single-stranded DNA-specific DHH superfamily exonuclease
VQQVVTADMQANWIKRANTEAKADGSAMLEEFKQYIRKYEQTSTYVPGFERFLKQCGNS